MHRLYFHHWNMTTSLYTIIYHYIALYTIIYNYIPLLYTIIPLYYINTIIPTIFIYHYTNSLKKMPKSPEKCPAGGQCGLERSQRRLGCWHQNGAADALQSKGRRSGRIDQRSGRIDQSYLFYYFY